VRYQTRLLTGCEAQMPVENVMQIFWHTA